MTELIHFYMTCSIPVQIKLGETVVDTIEVPIQEMVAEALQQSGHWMFEDGVMKW